MPGAKDLCGRSDWLKRSITGEVAADKFGKFRPRLNNLVCSCDYLLNGIKNTSRVRPFGPGCPTEDAVLTA